MNTENKIIEKCKKLMVETGDLEQVLSDLREKGFSKIQSMKILIEFNRVSLEEAKKIVHFSKTWSDVRERDEKFHNLVNKTLDNNS